MIRVAFALFAAALLHAHAPVSPQINGPLEVRGNLLFDTGTGLAVTLRGVAVDRADATTFGVIRVRWNVNSVRMPAGTDPERVAADVRMANDAGLFVILTAREAGAALWSAIAAKLKDNPRVMFSVAGEQAVVNAIRTAGARQVIAAPMSAPGQGENFVSEISAGGSGGSGPLYVGEWNLGSASVESLIQSLTDFDTRSISWTAAPFRAGGLVKDLVDFEPTPIGEAILIWTTGDPGGFGLLRADMIANSAGGLAGPVAPGELVTLYTEQLGPAAGATAQPGGDGRLPVELSGTTVLFDGVAVPLLFAGAYQINVQAPYDLTPGGRTTVQVFYRGIPSNRLQVSVAESAPEVFQDFSTRYALALNQDGALNAPGRPARAGSIVVLFASGGGQTSPPGRAGTPAPSPHPLLRLPTSLAVDGRDAEVLFAGEIPGYFGLLQINARVPVITGAVRPVPIALRVGSRASQGIALLWVSP